MNTAEGIVNERGRAIICVPPHTTVSHQVIDRKYQGDHGWMN